MNDTKLKKQIIDKIKDSNNVLVALNNNPTVDELSAALGLTLAINKIDKHATAVFSGNIPAAIEFLEPEKTFENTVLSLQDFIIALDKEKADHLRYKVDGDMVKIFITPYRTTIDESDLEFSQGDYNVDFVLAIGVQDAASLDKALESHGQILEDATVASVSLDQAGALGSINWSDKNASSYCEIVASLVKDLQPEPGVLDEQIATALLTGIVAATDRFSNEKTSSRVMTTAADLMAAGANQQLIAVQLQKADEISPDIRPVAAAPNAAATAQPAPPEQPAAQAGANGELAIDHAFRGTVDEVAGQVQAANQVAAAQEAEDELSRQLQPPSDAALPLVQPQIDYEETPPHSQVEPSLGGTLNATTEEAAEEGRRDLEGDQNHTILSHDSGHYVADQPSYQAPISAAADTTNGEPEVRDIFADAPAPQPAFGMSPQIHDLHGESLAPSSAPPVSTLPPMAPTAQPSAPFVAPPAPTGQGPVAPAYNAPTLAEIDAQNRSHTDLLGDVHAAFAGQPPQVNPVANGGLPPLPPTPPMPDFGTLPPLPDALQGSTGVPSEPLGSTLPPAQAPPEQGKSDPGQFKIPGM